MRPVERSKSTWYGDHRKSFTKTVTEQSKVILVGDSLVANLGRYPTVWDDHLYPLHAVNCGIGGDRSQNVLWRVEHMFLPVTTNVGVIHCGINDIQEKSAYGPHQIAENVLSSSNDILGCQLSSWGSCPQWSHFGAEIHKLTR